MNSTLMILLLSVVPGVLWVWFFYRQDKNGREPKPLMLKCLLFGGLMVLPAGIVETPFRGYIEGAAGLAGIAFASFFVVALVEETVKLMALRMATNREPHFNEVMDGIVYSVAVGLGFATLENVLYIGAFGAEVGILRAVLTNLAHASFSGVAGYYVGLDRQAWFKRADNADSAAQSGFLLKGCAIAVLLHGIYDFVVLSRLFPSWTVVVLIGAAYIYLRELIARAVSQPPFAAEPGKQAP